MTRIVEELGQDIRFAVRILAKAPAFTAVAVLSIALGIGANTAIFSLLDALMWRMLPVRQPETLQLLVHGQGSSYQSGFTFDQFRFLREKNRVLADFAVYSSTPLNVSIDRSIEPTAQGLLVSGGYFQSLGVSPVVGRAILPEDDRVPNGHPVAMLSYGYWKRRFGLSPSIVGRVITLSGTRFTVIGVTPPEFFGLEVGAAPDIFVPVMMQPAVQPSFENLLENPIIYSTWLHAVGRLRPGVGPVQAVAELDNLFRQTLPPAVGAKLSFLSDQHLRLQPAATGLSDLRRQFSQPLFILMALVGMVLLIACANTANLLLARAAARQPEFAMRLAVGAGRPRLVRQLLVESVALSVTAGACGILLARWATRLLVLYISSGRAPVVLDLHPDLRVLAFTAAVSIATGILFGLAPAVRATRPVPSRTQPRGALRPGAVLAVVQVALSLVLLIGAGLFVRSLENLVSAQPADAESILIVRVEPKGSDQRNIPGTTQRLDRIYQGLIQRVESIPGVRSASLAQFTPTSHRGNTVQVDLPSGERRPVYLPMVYPGYFRTLGIPIVAGRDFSAADIAENAPPSVVVNQAFARAVYPNENAVGKPCLVPTRARLPCRIIGVAADSRYADLKSEPISTAYSTFLQTPTGRGQMALYARVAGKPEAFLGRVREEVQQVDKDLPLFEVRTLADEVGAALVQERLMATLSGAFGALALLLAAVGLYGLLAFAVVQRTGEMGIRMALGATRANVLWMVLRQALLLVSIGVAAGVPAALAAARFATSRVAGLFFGLSAADPATITAAAAILGVVAFCAACIPARRASHVDPMTALRNE